MADKVKFKAFPTAFKLAAIKRLEAEEAVLPLARKLAFRAKFWDFGDSAGVHLTTNLTTEVIKCTVTDFRFRSETDGPSLLRLGGRGCWSNG